MDVKLQHLNKDQVDALISRYYLGENISNLLTEYKIEVKASQLVKLFPPKAITELCPYCKNYLMVKYESRSYKSLGIPECPVCKHFARENCKCFNCCSQIRNKIETERISLQKQRDIKRTEFLATLRIKWPTNSSFDELNFLDKIYLGALLREGIDESFSFIKPVEEFITPFAPTNKFQCEILNYLWRRGFITIHEDSICFSQADVGTDEFVIDLLKVRWSISIQSKHFTNEAIVNSLMNPCEDFDGVDAYILWQNIAINEALEYLVYTVHILFKIKYQIGIKTIAVLEELLKNYSVSQIYCIIYISSNGALRAQKENYISNHHAANLIIGKAQAYGDTMISNNRIINGFGRVKKCPESSLSKFLFEKVMRIGRSGFTTKPQILTLRHTNDGDNTF